MGAYIHDICRYKEHLVLVASQELREASLAPLSQDAPPSCLVDAQYSILEVVGAARHQGVPRPFFASYLKFDNRSVFHHTKTLRTYGFLTIHVCFNYLMVIIPIAMDIVN